MLSRLKIYQESWPIKKTRVAVVLRTGNTGFSNVAPCLVMGKDVGLRSHTFKLDTTGFVFFVIHVYVPSWFTSSSAINVSIHDLRLFKKRHTYKMINQKIADVITSFNRHLWHLCEEFRFHC